MLKIPNLPIKQQKFHFRDSVSFSENRIVNLKKRLYAQQFFKYIENSNICY